MGMAYHPTRWKFVEQQVVVEVIFSTIQCWTIMWGEVRKKNMSLAPGFFSRFGEIVSNWDMKLYHALPTSSTRLMYKMIEIVVNMSAQKCADQSPKNLSKLCLDMAWRGLKTCWGSIVHITQQWMTTSWQMGSDLVLPTGLKLQHHQAAQPTLGELEMKDLLLRIGPQLEKIAIWVLCSCLRIYRHDCFSSICDIFFLGGCFQTQAAPKKVETNDQSWQWANINMNQYEAVWSSMKQSYSQLNGFWMSYPQKKEIILKFLWYLTKKHANNWKVHQFLSRASREVTLAFPPSFATSMRRRPSATWRNGDVMRWGERQTKPGRRWVKWVKSGAGAPKYAGP